MNTAFSGQPVLDPNAFRGDFPILDQEIHRQKPLIYFDNAATTQHPRQVLDAMDQCYQHTYSNVHRGFHWLSEESSRLYEEARVAVQKFINARWPEEVLFTSGTTLAINTVARSWGDQNIKAGDEILLSIMEHHSNIVPWQQLAERTGAVVRFFGITDDALPDLEDYARLLNEKTKVVGITAVSNTLGTFLPIAEISAKAHEAGAVVVVDAAQHVPHAPTDVIAWGADFLAFSGHKMLGPSGVGILYGRRELLESMPPFLGGGSMIDMVTTEGFTPGELPAKFEAGTPPIVETIGLAAAIRYLDGVGLNRIAQHERTLAAIAHARMSEIDGLTILGPSPEHKCGIVSFVVDGVSAQDLSILADLQGVAIRVGHHCTMPLHNYLNISASCRASFYLYNTAAEVHRFVDVLQEILPRLR